jgi:hypothetical protein
MNELPQSIPDAQVLLSLQPEELAGKMLFILRKRNQGRNTAGESFILSTLLSNLWPTNYVAGYEPPYPAELRNEINLAIAESWGWLIAQALLVPVGTAGNADSYVLGRRALKFQDESQFATFIVTRMLPKDSLHPRLADKVWSAFLRGEYDVAAFQAMKAVEVYVREAAKLPDGP